MFVFVFDILELVRFSGGGDLLCLNRVQLYINTTFFDYFFDLNSFDDNNANEKKWHVVQVMK